MWIVSKALHLSPFDSKISALTLPQITWILANHTRDQEEEFDRFKFLCYFINPEAAKSVFEDKQAVEKAETSDDDFLQEIKAHTKNDVSLNDLEQPLETPVELDTIEKVE